MNSPPPRSDTEPPAPRTDFASLLREPPPAPEPVRKPPRTDFRSLGGGKVLVASRPKRKITDWLIEVTTPTLIVLMVYAVVFYLLDVRYVYTAVHDRNLRFVALMYIIGIVALNRLIARDGSEEGLLYFLGLAGSIGLYTISTTTMYGVESVARNFMNDNVWLAAGFNMTVVAFVWWLVNRLTHECCVDENPTAGEVGILTGTIRNWTKRSQRDESASRHAPVFRRQKNAPVVPEYVIEAYDPTEGYKPKAKPAPKHQVSLADRLSKRHPGMSIFYFSIPVMLAFAFGLRVIQHGGPGWVRNGAIYMGLYCTAALSLLMLTSLGGLREYFRARKVQMPDRIGFFWIGLGFVMVAMVLLGALQLPMPSLPPIAYVDEHKVDEWDRNAATFELQRTRSFSDEAIATTERFVDRLGKAVLVIFGVFIAYTALRALGLWAAYVGRQRDRYPAFIAKAFNRLDRVLERLLRLPTLPSIRSDIRVSPKVATSTGFRNSLGDTRRSELMTPADHVMYAYDALCALALDLGVPREPGETPNEYIKRFPRNLRALREVTTELTSLYQIAAYSPHELDERTLDRVRRFWLTYERVRRRFVR
ncbi:MAG: DUF4129 domain-containing protein [Candidatus Hydrogenedentes bacterium]|nr:DUF4129 domain-containing protein [Candidatus Hydrogenedentota bacterium]